MRGSTLVKEVVLINANNWWRFHWSKVYYPDTKMIIFGFKFLGWKRELSFAFSRPVTKEELEEGIVKSEHVTNTQS